MMRPEREENKGHVNANKGYANANKGRANASKGLPDKGTDKGLKPLVRAAD
jgi:hypothetical protein